MFQSIQRSALVSWKSTLIGGLVFVITLSRFLIAVLDNDPETIANWEGLELAFLAMVGGIVIKDGDKTTEDHQTKRKRFPQ